MNNIVVINLPL